MGFKCGIVGLPNVGKSTLFNALTNSIAAEAANYPFCTIEPNIGNISVPDDRLEKLAELAGSQKLIPTKIDFVDIAGLVKGASKGEGLGNKFLGHIREVDAIAYVLRCFDNDNVIHVANRIDPVEDAEIIKIELIMADIESLEKKAANLEKKAKNDKVAARQCTLIAELIPWLRDNKTVREFIIHKGDNYNADDLKNDIHSLQLLTSKPFFYICNVSEADVTGGNKYTEAVSKIAEKEHTRSIIISASIESEIAVLADVNERKQLIIDFGLEISGLDKIVRCGYDVLDLITFFTVGPQEAHAWTVVKGTLAPQAAGVIHSDFEKGFIRAEVISCTDYLHYKTEAAVKDAGKMRLEGREYVVQDGDIMHFRFNN